jgi:hypothetical protein
MVSETGRPETLSLLPLVKAYPNLSRQYGEVSCVAGLTINKSANPQWIRIYPVPFRALSNKMKFRKYQPIRVKARRPNNDLRPESRRVDIESIEITDDPIGTARGWEARRNLVEPSLRASMCELMRKERKDRTSLAIFRPAEVLDLVIEAVEPDPDKGERAEAWAAQAQLLGASETQQQRKALEQIPFRFKYYYRCSDPKCKTHTQSIVDWEIAQQYRRLRDREDWKELIRKKWFDEICGDTKDTALIVGNQHQYRKSFLVLGVWWPPVRRQLSLADTGDA